jgi:hypothetical protein
MNTLWNLVAKKETLQTIPRGRHGKKNGTATKQEYANIFRRLNGGMAAPTRMDKACLTKAMFVLRAVKRVQKRYKIRFKKTQAEFNKLLDTLGNKTCPLSLEPLKPPVFVYVNASGYRRGYQLNWLLDYILTTGKGLDPVSRTPYTEGELKQLDELAKANRISCKSVHCAVFGEDRKMYERKREREEVISILDHTIHESFDNVLALLQGAPRSNQEYKEATNELPGELREFKERVLALGLLDHESCANVLNALQGELRGIQGISDDHIHDMTSFIELLQLGVNAIARGIGPATLEHALLDADDELDLDYEDDDDEETDSDDDSSEPLFSIQFSVEN